MLLPGGCDKRSTQPASPAHQADTPCSSAGTLGLSLLMMLSGLACMQQLVAGGLSQNH